MLSTQLVSVLWILSLRASSAWSSAALCRRSLLSRHDYATDGPASQWSVSHHSWCFPQTQVSFGRSRRSLASDVETQLHWQAYARQPLLFLSRPRSFWRSGMLFLHGHTYKISIINKYNNNINNSINERMVIIQRLSAQITVYVDLIPDDDTADVCIRVSH